MSRRWVRPLGWVIGVVGLLLVGFAGGQLLFPRTVVAPDRLLSSGHPVSDCRIT